MNEDTELSYLMLLVDNNDDEFSTEFMKWLPQNYHVWKAFTDEAFKVINKGFKHYSSRTIVCVLRHHSAVSEVGSMWKLNNNLSPYLARLFDLRYPNYKGLWEYREVKRAKRDKYFRDAGAEAGIL